MNKKSRKLFDKRSDILLVILLVLFTIATTITVATTVQGQPIESTPALEVNAIDTENIDASGWIEANYSVVHYLYAGESLEVICVCE